MRVGVVRRAGMPITGYPDAARAVITRSPDITRSRTWWSGHDDGWCGINHWRGSGINDWRGSSHDHRGRCTGGYSHDRNWKIKREKDACVGGQAGRADKCGSDDEQFSFHKILFLIVSLRLRSLPRPFTDLYGPRLDILQEKENYLFMSFLVCDGLI